MTTIIEFLSDKPGLGKVLVEAGPDAEGLPVLVAGGRANIEKATQSFESAVAGIRPIAAALFGQISQLGDQITSIELEFGLKFTADAGIVLARAATECHCTVSITWAGAHKSP